MQAHPLSGHIWSVGDYIICIVLLLLSFSHFKAYIIYQETCTSVFAKNCAVLGLFTFDGLAVKIGLHFRISYPNKFSCITYWYHNECMHCILHRTVATVCLLCFACSYITSRKVKPSFIALGR